MKTLHGVRVVGKNEESWFEVWYYGYYVGSASTLGEANWLFSYHEDKQTIKGLPNLK